MTDPVKPPVYGSRRDAERLKTETMEKLKAEADKLREKDKSLSEGAALLSAMRAHPILTERAKSADRVLKG